MLDNLLPLLFTSLTQKFAILLQYSATAVYPVHHIYHAAWGGVIKLESALKELSVENLNIVKVAVTPYLTPVLQNEIIILSNSSPCTSTVNDSLLAVVSKAIIARLAWLICLFIALLKLPL